MIPIQTIREKADWVKERLAVKNFDTTIVDEIVALDEKRRKVQTSMEELKAKLNESSKAIGGLMQQGKKEEAQQLREQVTAGKGNITSLEEELKTLEQEQYGKLVLLPNTPDEIVPTGKTPEENVTVKEGGEKPELGANPQPHWELTKKYNLIDFELGTKVTGSGFPFYIGKGAKLQRSLIQYFLDFNTEAGYTEYLPPFMVNEDSAFATGSLPDKEGQMYHATEDNFYLIPTAEVPVTNVYRDVIIKAADLPVKMTAYSPCFRREAGSYGKDVRGLNRLHQFEKVEIVQITEPEKSMAALDDMVAHVERLLQSLNLPYRILLLCGGDMSFTSSITYDFEVWSAAQQRWLEVSSVSNFKDFQTNRLKCRYKNEGGKTVLCHSLNGSSLALPRIMAALLENNQTEEGIKLPEVLVPYFKGEMIG
jgi:seryl-tRNA synthetase